MNKIEYFFEDTASLKISESTFDKYINFLIKNELKTVGPISFIFCSDSYLLDINKQYLNHDFYTDILTFDYCEESMISGDLFISVDRVKENAGTFEVEFKIELLRVMFHGILHLAGYGDKTEGEKRIMRNKEDYYLSEVDLEEIEI